MEAKKFAKENAGKFFRFGNRVVKVVGYSGVTQVGVLVSGVSDGWRKADHFEDMVFVCNSRGFNLWWVISDQLEPITVEEFATEKAGKKFNYDSLHGHTQDGAEFVTLCGYSDLNRDELKYIIGREHIGWSHKMFEPEDKVLKKSTYDRYWYVSQTELEEVL